MDIWVVSTFWLLWTMLARNIHVQGIMWTYVLSSLGYIPRSGRAGSQSKSVFNFLRNWQTVFFRGCTILHSHQQCMRVPISTHPPTKMVIFCLFDYSHPTECEVSSQWGFDLRFPDGLWRWASFHVLIGHLYILFGGMSIQILCPFFNWAICLFFSSLLCKSSYAF